MVHRPVCDRVVDLVPDPDGRDPRSDGPPGHPLPRPGQHLQHRHHQHPQGGGTHGHRGLDVGLHTLCIWCSHRVSFSFTFLFN